ncbi:glycosyltransferase family 2 protein [Enterococcus avium]|uniref:glycosyltransferase family 2 protein n=1 Tax=Enterococcus avium TaxID=33945 RepID=UPI0028905894|nr:glycosyltransferase family 2 protein [Enterococcus avium]MDT2391068.1 glycosyltransferase family 2 protein [Enterococcus avium]
MTKVSIVLPTYNATNFVERCMQSIISQKFEDYEVIFVNDGSTDDTLTKLKKFKEEDSRVKIITTINQGTGKARETGVANATGKYIFFCDPDDEIAEDLLSDNIPILEKSGGEMCIFSWISRNSNKTTDYAISDEPTFILSNKDFATKFDYLFSKGNMFSNWNKIYRRDILLPFLGKFPSMTIGEDFLLNLKIYKKIKRISINLGKSYYIYHSNTGSADKSYKENKGDMLETHFVELETLVKYYRKRYQDKNIGSHALSIFAYNNFFTEIKNIAMSEETHIEKVNLLYSQRLNKYSNYGKMIRNRSLFKQFLIHFNLQRAVLFFFEKGI